MIRPFKSVENVRPGRSVFDLSYSKLMDANMGLLYVAQCDEVVPGDKFTLDFSVVARCMPLVCPMLHEVNITIHSYFVPYRLLWDDWEDFISGGVDGDDSSVLPRMPYPSTFLGSLWDNLGFPESPGGSLTATDTLPLAFPQRAYNLIWNEYYRDETLQTEVDITANEDLLRRAWTKDYWTSALPFAQRGISPALPISGSAPLSGDANLNGSVAFNFAELLPSTNWSYDTGMVVNTGTDNNVHVDSTATANTNWNQSGLTSLSGTADTSAITADLSGATTFDVNDLRLAWQIQKWMERNARSGVRYTEFLQAHFGVGGNLDSRLQRPEYIGGIKAPVIISEVLQTSATGATGTPQGNLAGHGITVAQQHAGKYYAQEYGLIISLLSIMPKPAYSQGINRQWLRRTRYDFYFPEFSTLGEQAVEDSEIYWQETDALNKHVFGFQGRYDEMRYKPNITVGEMRPGQSMDYWTLTRSFASLPALDDTFIQCDPDPRAWAVQVGAPQFVMHIGNHIKAIRPIPVMGTPGLVDHH